MDVLIRYHRMRGFNTLWQVGHRPRRHRDADRRRAPAEGAGHRRATISAARSSSSACGSGRRSPARRSRSQMRRLGAVGRLVARALHDGRGPVGRGARGVRAAVRGRPDLPRQAAGQLGSGARAPRCPTSRSTARRRTAGSGRSAIRSPTAAARSSSRPRAPRRCSATPRSRCIPDDERYRALIGKQRARCRSTGRDDPGHRRRVRRPRVRHRRGEDHAGARLQRLRGRPAPRACRRSSIFNARRDDQRQRAGEVSRPRSLRGAQGGASPTSRPRACSCRKSRTR